MRPLDGIMVLEFCQFMAGPSAGLKLADLGARVIKIERPGKGEGGRQIAIKNLFVDGSSLVFHTINRNKESYAANLKDPKDLERVKKLIKEADVMTHNFRPGVMERIGLDYQMAKALNPKLIYAAVSGYGTGGPWAGKPGQDLLVQCLSGLAYLSGDESDGPTPFGLATADIITGSHLAHGILAALFRRSRTGKGGLVEVSLLESVVDFQFEVITTYLNDGRRLPKRARKGNAHAYLSAPYGVYKTKNGYMALAMGSLTTIGRILQSDALMDFTDQRDWFIGRDEIMDILCGILQKRDTAHWLQLLGAKGIWVSEVYDYETLLGHEAYSILEMDQKLKLLNGEEVHTTRCPIRINDERLFAERPAPRIGQHTETIAREFGL
ncbi:MAG: CoA transferase [Bacteroidota bacterium]